MWQKLDLAGKLVIAEKNVPPFFLLVFSPGVCISVFLLFVSTVAVYVCQCIDGHGELPVSASVYGWRSAQRRHVRTPCLSLVPAFPRPHDVCASPRLSRLLRDVRKMEMRADDARKRETGCFISRFLAHFCCCPFHALALC